jgi:hypothetical protein
MGKQSLGSRVVLAPILLAVLSLVIALAGCQIASKPEATTGPQAVGSLPGDSPELLQAIAVQERNTDNILAIPGVVGIATGVAKGQSPFIMVLASEASAAAVPASLEGLAVKIRVTDGLFAMDDLADLPPQAAAAASAAMLQAASVPTDRFARPVPIGVATGNRYFCASGTIGARVKDASGRIGALSNNHVFALENRAPINSWILQPGLVETSCVVDSANAMALLKAFVPIKFGGATNTMDVAVAITNANYLGKSTPSDGYGMPKSTPVAASVGQAVQKYGRTTALTHGTVSGVNATVFVGYESGTARFTGQILVESTGAFILPGDSGSLLVADPGREPVGLCFAGNADGTLGIANPIGPILTKFGITIDGE